MSDMTLVELRRGLAQLIVNASDGAVDLEQVLNCEGPLFSLGMSSLGYVRVMDAMESEMGVYIDFVEWWSGTLDALAQLVYSRSARDLHEG